MRLRDYQNDVLNLYMKNRFSILMASRQVGKTISAAIAILYYCIFNNDKTVMIAANKKATTDEIVDKIKSIYYLLPFWLKPGIVNWNKSQITFGDNNCKIRSATATKTAAIGFTIDILYLDEFAHVANNISEDFYRSIFPTVSAVENSKIIITSTPNGYNLFWKLLSGAEKPEGDRDKNRFASMRVYWYQVPGRFVTYLRLNESLMDKLDITKEELYHWVKDMGFEEEVRDDKGFVIKEGLKMVENFDLGKFEIHIPNKEDCLPDFIRKATQDTEWENPLSEFFRTLKYQKGDGEIENSGENGENSEGGNIEEYKLMDLCEISSWKEDAIKNIGSLESFNQEYDLQFLAGSRTLLDSITMERVKNGIHDFEHLEIPQIYNKTYMNYEDLKWIKDRPDLFSLANAKNYHIVASIDLSEGLGGDYSVVNIFRLMVKDEADYPLNFKSIYDFFKLEQIGMFRSNMHDVGEIAELCYLLFFDVFDENKMGSVLEVNAFGGEFLKDMRNLYNGRNNYSSHVFFRYKHRIDALKPNIGIKLRSNKNQFIKMYQKRIKLNDIIIHNMETLQEMTTFIKKDTASGYKYEAESGSHDDCVPPETLIHTYDGVKKIVDVVVGDLVMTHTGKWQKVLKTGKRFSDKIFKIKTRKKLDLSLTSNHDLYVKDKNNRSEYINDHKWLNIDNGLDKNYGLSYINDNAVIDISEIDMLKVCNKNKFTEIDGKLYSILYENKNRINPKTNSINRFIELDLDFCFVIGYFLAEGTTNKHQTIFASHKKESSFRNKVIQWAEKNNIPYFVKNTGDNSNSLYLTSKILRNYFNTFGKKNNKKLPRELTKLPLEKLEQILHGYVLGDGTFTSNQMRVCSISPTISFDIYDILIKMDYLPTINKFKNNKNYIYSVSINEKYKVDLLSKIDDKLLECKTVNLYEKKRNVTYSKQIDNYNISSITKIIEEDYNDYVYNIEVENDNSYIANGIIVHNCMMTVVETASVFENYKFHEMCNDVFGKLTDNVKNKIQKLLDDAPNIEAMDYNVLFNAKRTANAMRSNTGYGTPTTNSNPYLNNGGNSGGSNPYINDPWKNNQ